MGEPRGDSAPPPADRAEIAILLDRARAAGVGRFLVPGTTVADSRDAVEIAAAFEGVRAAVGVHPHEAKDFEPARDGAKLEELAARPGVVAIGEIGLDFHYDYSPRDVQRDVFRKQVRLARDVGLPLIIHTREADDEAATILEEEGAKETGGVIHCFTGGEDLARRALALGFYVSFSGIVAFPRSETIQAVARSVPEDRLLVETDAPFLAPPPHRGKRNEPAFVVDVARKVAGLRGETPEAVGAAAKRNFERLFRRA
jgi:TatD DNase family protein